MKYLFSLYLLISVAVNAQVLPPGKYLKVKDDGSGFELFTLNAVTSTKLADSMAIARGLIVLKQNSLVSGTTLKTINGNNLLGSGDISISSEVWGGITGTLANQLDLTAALLAKQDALGFTAVPITRTINSLPLSGNITLTKSDLGATTVGGNLFTLANPSAIRFIRINADNTASTRTASELLIDIGGQAAGSYALQSITVNAQPLSANVNITTVTGNAGTATALQNARLIDGKSFNGSADIVTDHSILAYEALGSPILCNTVDFPLQTCNTSTALADGQIKYTAIYLPKAVTLTGIKVYVRVLGSYTADNNNRVGLYSYSGGTITLVASSANSGALWTSAANAIQTIPFSSTYAASAGIYFVAMIYNNSAQVTAPALASGTALNNLVMASTAYGFTNSAKLYGTSTGTDLPASIAMSSITASVIPSWVALY